MIIRPVCKIEFTALPNAVLNDTRLSADTRAMLALVLSKSKGWELRPGPLARALSRKGGKSLGRTRLSRMFDEATEAGYMARSAEQGHQDDGKFGKYVYFVGMPDDVAAAVKHASVAFLPHARKPHTGEPHTGEPHTGEPHTGEPHAANQHTNQKVKSLETTESKKTPSTSPTEFAGTSEVADDELPFDAEGAKSRSMNGHSLNRPPMPPVAIKDNPHEQAQGASDWRARRDRQHAAREKLKASIIADESSENSGNGHSLNRDAKCAIEGAERIQHRIAQLLGDGDVARGWFLLMQLSDSDRDQLTAQGRADKLTDLTLTAMRIKAGGEQ